MNRLHKLYETAKNSPKNLSFNELCALAEGVGFTLRKRKTGTSHRIYKHSRVNEIVNFQSRRGKAKPYQVKKLLDMIDDYGLLED